MPNTSKVVASKHSIDKIFHSGTLYLTVQDEHNKKRTIEASRLKKLLIAGGWTQFDSKHIDKFQGIVQGRNVSVVDNEVTNESYEELTREIGNSTKKPKQKNRRNIRR